MLRALNITDFVLVDRLELEFQPGFSVLTGETGAGKSILLDALGLALGGRGESGMVRSGAARAEVTAEFDLEQLPALRSWLHQHELEGDPGLCLLRRTLEAGGRSRAFINGCQVTLQQLKAAGEFLVDIHGQHAHYSLLKPAVQRQILDAYAGAVAQAQTVAGCYRSWQEARQRRLQAEQQSQEQLAERDRLTWVVDELTALRFTVEEWQTLQESHRRLAHAADLQAGVEEVNAVLSEDGLGILVRLKSAQSRLAGLAEYDLQLAEPLKLLDSSLIDLNEAAHELLRYGDRLELDPSALAQSEARIAAVTGAAHKFRVKPAELADLLERAQAQLAELELLSDIVALVRAEQDAESAYLQQANALSRLRRAGAEKLGKAVTQAMQGLALQGGSFAVLLQVSEPCIHGQEEVEFQVSPHSGQALAALAKTASGGELSRIGLSLQTVLSGVSGTPTLIFDEVDAGIGGGVAEIVGRMLAELGVDRQVLCVTHLPQVAACAGVHYAVSKTKGPAGVVTRVGQLAAKERINEIARMLGGVTITETTRRHAEEMLGG